MAKVGIDRGRAVRWIRFCSRFVRLRALGYRHAARRPLRRLTTIMMRATTSRM